MIRYTPSCEEIVANQLEGFFVGWLHPPTPEEHLRILQASHVIALAIDQEADKVVGFATAITDGVFSAYLPLLEVLPAYQGQGIGSALVRHVLDQLGHLHMIDLTCDPDVQPFYARLGLVPSTGMMMRNQKARIG